MPELLDLTLRQLKNHEAKIIRLLADSLHKELIDVEKKKREERVGKEHHHEQRH